MWSPIRPKRAQLDDYCSKAMNSLVKGNTLNRKQTSLRKQEKQMKTKVRVLLIWCGFALATSCSSAERPESQPQPASGTTVATSGGSAHEAVVEAMKKWITVKSFRHGFTTTSNGASSTGTMEFVAPDRVHFVMDIAGEPFESITIGQIEYTKDSDGQWLKTSSEARSNTSNQRRFFADPRYVAELTGNVSDAQFVGSEAVEGVPTRVYQFKHRLPDSTDVYSSRLWVAANDGLPRKFETAHDFVSEGVKMAGKSSGVFYDYDAQIQITAPIP
jgi:hypothetical protein